MHRNAVFSEGSSCAVQTWTTREETCKLNSYKHGEKQFMYVNQEDDRAALPVAPPHSEFPRFVSKLAVLVYARTFQFDHDQML